MTVDVKVPAVQGSRARVSLDGPWRFAFESDAAESEIEVPAPWQVQRPDLHDKSGVGIYSREIVIPQAWRGRQVAILFGAVSYFTEVSINDCRLGHHEGGYLPFEFVIPGEFVGQAVRVEVKVTLPSSDRAEYPDFPFDEVPHGKQSWYGVLGGIWQSVWLECRDEAHISTQRIRADLATGRVAVDLELSQPFSGGVVATIFDRTGQPVAGADVAVADVDTVALELLVETVIAWSIDDPALYRLVLELRKSQSVVDQVADGFGFRTFESKDGRLYLNGQPFYMRGALDQDYYPNGICTPPSLEFLEHQARKAKELGLNLLRCHIKVPDPRYYDVADRYGLLVWTEIPNVQTFTPKSAQRLLDTMRGILRRDANHPSIVIWTIVNEDWGTRLADSALQREWLSRAYHWLKAEDPTRLVVDNSPCAPNFHIESDIDDYHYYAAVPEMAAEWAEWVGKFASRPDWTYSPNGDAVRSGREPLIVSEFGVWGLPEISNQLQDGSEPFWTRTGLNWPNAEGVSYPHGMEDRFRAFHLNKLFGSLGSFCDATQWHQFKALKYEIEEMRRYASIQGYVITELTDVHWEANGLMDMERNPRVYHDRFREINSDIVIVPRCKHYSAWSGSAIDVTVEIATGGRAIPAQAELHVLVDGSPSTVVPVPVSEATTVASLGAVRVQLPSTARGQIASISFRLAANGVELAKNSLDVSVLAPRARPQVSVYARDAAIAEHLVALGYNLVAPDEAQVRVVHLLDASDITAAERGACFAVLADGVDLPFGNLRSDRPNWNYPNVTDRQQAMPQLTVVERQGTIWQGNWITGFSWVRRSGVFARLPGGPLIDMAFAGVAPRRVISGFRAVEFDGLIQSGMVSGWVHKPCALIAERRVGEGKITATTFGLLRAAPAEDAVATTLLDCITEVSATRT